MTVRKEEREDYEEVYRLIRTAFASAEHADGTEQDLVTELRNSEAFLPELSLVVEEEGRIIGHILFTNAHVGHQEVLVLAPLSVLPEYQRKGVGASLIREGHRIARDMGYQYSMVLGNNSYYSRFGYEPAEKLGVNVPDGIPAEYFMGMKLNRDADDLNGDLIYAEEFGIR